ncbi:MAG: hypothetical protein WBM92_09725 [Aureibaculum sp.]
MKKTIFGLFMLGFMSQSYAQKDEVLLAVKLQKKEVPQMVINSVEKNHPNLDIVDFMVMPTELVSTASVKKSIKPVGGEVYESYIVNFKGKTSLISATYNKEGNLISTLEHFKNKKVPMPIVITLSNTRPEWNVINGYKKLITYTATGEVKNERFKITIVNGDKIKKIFTDANGLILNSNGRVKKQIIA